MWEHCWRCRGPGNTQRSAPSAQATHASSSGRQRPLPGLVHQGPRGSRTSSWPDRQVPPGGTANPRLRPGTRFPAVSGSVFWSERGEGQRRRLASSPSRYFCSGTGSAAPEPSYGHSLFQHQEAAEARPANERSSPAQCPALLPVAGTFKMARRARFFKINFIDT